MITRKLLIPLTLALSACTSDAPRAGLTISVDTVGSTVRVRNVGELPEWTAREVLTMGALTNIDRPSADEFTDIRGVIADAEGRIYVADVKAAEVRVFDASGKPLRTIGRRGAGPGEFGNLQSIGWLGDTLVALDPLNGRIGFLTREGRWLGQRPHRNITGSGVRLHQTGLHELYSPAFRSRLGALEVAFARQIPAGSLDTIAAPSDNSRPVARVMCQHANGGISFWLVSFAPRVLRNPGPAATLLAAWSADYHLAYINLLGDTARIIERDVPRIPVDEAAWKQEESEYDAWRTKLPPGDCQPRTLPRPDVVDLIRGVYYDDGARIWVERRIAGGFGFDVFDAEGRGLGTLRTPEHVEEVAPYVRANRLYLVVRDTMGVQYVKAFEINEK